MGGGYQVILLPRARNLLDDLERQPRQRVIAALRSELDPDDPGAERIAVDDRTYYRAPLSAGFDVLYLPLTGAEIHRQVELRVLREDRQPVYAIASLEPRRSA